MKYFLLVFCFTGMIITGIGTFAYIGQDALLISRSILCGSMTIALAIITSSLKESE